MLARRRDKPPPGVGPGALVDFLRGIERRVAERAYQRLAPRANTISVRAGNLKRTRATFRHLRRRGRPSLPRQLPPASGFYGVSVAAGLRRLRDPDSLLRPHEDLLPDGPRFGVLSGSITSSRPIAIEKSWRRRSSRPRSPSARCYSHWPSSSRPPSDVSFWAMRSGTLRSRRGYSSSPLDTFSTPSPSFQ